MKIEVLSVMPSVYETQILHIINVPFSFPVSIFFWLLFMSFHEPNNQSAYTKVVVICCLVFGALMLLVFYLDVTQRCMGPRNLVHSMLVTMPTSSIIVHQAKVVSMNKFVRPFSFPSASVSAVKQEKVNPNMPMEGSVLDHDTRHAVATEVSHSLVWALVFMATLGVLCSAFHIWGQQGRWPRVDVRASDDWMRLVQHPTGQYRTFPVGLAVRNTTAGSRHLRCAVFIVNRVQKVKKNRTQLGCKSEQLPDFHIRNMKLQDTGPVFYLGDETFVTGNLYRTWDEWEPVALLSSCPEYCFVAEAADGEIVGFVLGSVFHKKTISIGYVDWVVVAEGWQRMGIGTKLVDKVATSMQVEEGVDLLMADTPAENSAAISFFCNHLAYTEKIPHVYLMRFGHKNGQHSNEELIAGPRVPPTNDVNIRPAMVDDLINIYRLGERCFRPHTNLSRTWDENEVMDMFSQNSDLCLVATVKKEMAGFCMGSTVEKRKSKKPYGYLMWLAVDPSFGRRGIGAKLLQAFDEITAERGCYLTLVDTQADNEAALQFFERNGFGDRKMHFYMAKPCKRLPQDAGKSQEALENVEEGWLEEEGEEHSCKGQQSGRSSV